ncbi:MAG TPA: DUF4926 domain-containing protein [bacterium]|nr:DUF4926 domain-containing protein [bacterium]
MTFKLLEPVVLVKDKPDFGLKTGDLGTVVEIYDDRAVEVEFVKTSGETLAVVTLSADDVRAGERDDVLAVRSSKTATT